MDIFLPHCQSLKDKRKIIKSLKDKIKNNYNVSILEADYNEKWQRALISIAMLTDKKANALGMIDSIRSIIEANGEMEILNQEIDER